MYIPKPGGHTNFPKPATNVGAGYDQHLAKRNTHFDSMRINNTIDSVRRLLEITVLSFPFCMHNLIIIISTINKTKQFIENIAGVGVFVPFHKYVGPCLLVSNCK